MSNVLIPDNRLERDEQLEVRLLELKHKIIQTSTQQKIRKEVLSQRELEALGQRLPSAQMDDVPNDHPEAEAIAFAGAFDSNGRDNMVALAELRRVGQREIVLHMAFECGFLANAEYQRHLAHLGAISEARTSVSLQYNSDGQLFSNGTLVGAVRVSHGGPTKMHTILTMFQEQNWPSSVQAPSSWSGDDVASARRQLSDRFAPQITFHESDGGSSIQIVCHEVAPN